MKATEAIRQSIEMADMISKMYLGDLSDQEMMVRPHPKCNHIKWQLGHLIGSDHEMVNAVCPGSMPELPAGFTDRYTKEQATVDDPSSFDSKEELMKLYAQQRAASLEALAGLSDDGLDKPGPEHMKDYAPTVASVFTLVGSHWLMHAGQWAVVRRKLGREPMM